VLHDYALYKSTFTLLYFTLLRRIGLSRWTRSHCAHFAYVQYKRRWLDL